MLGLLGLALGGLVGWQVWHPPALHYIQAVAALDGALMQQWGSLPKPVQERLTDTYQRLGWASPAQRK